ncbi:MAG: T9SS type A sorting domain-containing protein, partial [Bacteroidota bacterium]|nr:T9SS type A sorting domain-containing protein [Bacteroidota bacterium]
VTAWGAQAGFDDGFQTGESFSWRLWDASTGIEYSATAVYNTFDFPNAGVYLTNGMSGLYSLIALTVETQSIILPGTWSIFSTYIDPFEPLLDSIFSGISSNIALVKNGNGLVYWPLYSLNAIGNIVIGEGYQIKCYATQILDIDGLSVDPVSTVINIQAGWSIIGYLHQTPANIVTMMSSIVTHIAIMKSGSGQVYWPLYSVNGIGNMIPGEGYQIKLDVAQSFSFPAISPSTKLNNQPKAVHFKNEINTGNNMTIGFPQQIWDITPEVGDEIGAYNQQGQLVGAVVFQNGNLALTVWGQDEIDLSGQGMIDGNKIGFKLWQKQSGQEFDIVVNNWYEGNDVYQKDGISVANSIGVNKSDQLFQNHPNPYANSTEISFFLSEEGNVKIELYNILGTKLAVIASDNYNAGHHSFIFNATGLTSGTYFYRIVSEQITETKSMTIQK